MSTFPLGAASEDFVAHELAHQWFGNSASVEALGRPLDRGGRLPPISRCSGRTATILPPSTPRCWTIYDDIVANNVGPAVVDAPEEMFTDRIYLRGASALYALRLKVGDRTFFRILRTFHAFYRGRNATSQDFINVAVFVSHDRSVRKLLHAWLYEEPVPPLPGHAAPQAKRGPVPRPDVVGTRCGPRRAIAAPAAH